MNKQLRREDLRVVNLESRAGLRVQVLNLGATIRVLEVPLPSGPRNVVLSYDEMDGYLDDQYFLGATVGPFANRICDARFKLDDMLVELDANDEATGHCLHSGHAGLHRQLFSLHENRAESLIECNLRIADGADGFPGNREFEIRYHWLDDWALAIDFLVSTDRDTVVSLANHCYFNLGGSIDDHQLRVAAESYTPLDVTGVPSGEISAVTQTEFDLREWQRLGDRCFDDNFALQTEGRRPRLAAQLRESSGNLQLDLLTTQPGLQLYTGDSLGEPFVPRAGLCLEAQRFPDSPNQALFPSARLTAGSSYRQRSVYAFKIISH